MSRGARFGQRWSVVAVHPFGQRVREVSGHWTLRSALADRDQRRSVTRPGLTVVDRASDRYRIVPSRWAPARRIGAWLALELAYRGPQSTRQLRDAGVLPRMLVLHALRALERSGAIAYEVPDEAAPVIEMLTAIGLFDDTTEIGRWRVQEDAGRLIAAAAVPGGGWEWAVRKRSPGMIN